MTLKRDMIDLMQHNELLVKLCQSSDATAGIGSLIGGLKTIYPELEFKHILTRGGWHRLGGVVDAGHQRITDHIVHWAETETDGDVDELVAQFVDSNYFATNLAGITHYFTAATGDSAKQFIQLEIEELQEVIDRQLIIEDWFPDSIEEFLEPLDYPRLKPEPVGQPSFLFRRVTSIEQLVDESSASNSSIRHLKRFLEDWDRSSAASQRFCDHWALSLRKYMDSDCEAHTSGKPITVDRGAGSTLSETAELCGEALAQAIHHYDHDQGYPFSWYFMMLSSKSENYKLADAVFKDLEADFDYLPEKDLEVLRDWELHPYSV